LPNFFWIPWRIHPVPEYRVSIHPDSLVFSSHGNILIEGEKALMIRYETILKGISLGGILLGAGLLIWRMHGQLVGQAIRESE